MAEEVATELKKNQELRKLGIDLFDKKPIPSIHFRHKYSLGNEFYEIPLSDLKIGEREVTLDEFKSDPLVAVISVFNYMTASGNPWDVDTYAFDRNRPERIRYHQLASFIEHQIVERGKDERLRQLGGGIELRPGSGISVRLYQRKDNPSQQVLEIKKSDDQKLVRFIHKDLGYDPRIAESLEGFEDG